ncbi:MAG: ABC transporter permease [Clostridiales bacterium]|jgi:spermidine/putrescine transport system permease protein|nr:ABC transporter permease [Clostridiales bacterium]
MPRLKFRRSYFAAPYLLLNVLFIIVPLVFLLVMAFTGEDGGFTFANFASFFTGANALRVMGRSFLIAFLTTAGCLLVGYPVALILSNSKINTSAVLVLLFVLPMWINSLLRTYAIKSVFDAVNMQNEYAKVTIAMIYDFFPFMLLPLYTAMVNLDKSLTEAASDLGAGAFTVFLRVRLPLSVPGIISGVLMVFMPTVSTFAISEIVSGKPETYLFGNLINDFFGKNEGLYGLGSAYAFILLMLICLTLFAANKLAKGGELGRGGLL